MPTGETESGGKVYDREDRTPCRRGPGDERHADRWRLYGYISPAVYASLADALEVPILFIPLFTRTAQLHGVEAGIKAVANGFDLDDEQVEALRSMLRRAMVRVEAE